MNRYARIIQHLPPLAIACAFGAFSAGIGIALCARHWKGDKIYALTCAAAFGGGGVIFGFGIPVLMEHRPLSYWEDILLVIAMVIAIPATFAMLSRDPPVTKR
jgi:hypothetical protein